MKQLRQKNFFFLRTLFLEFLFSLLKNPEPCNFLTKTVAFGKQIFDIRQKKKN